MQDALEVQLAEINKKWQETSIYSTKAHSYHPLVK